jgi:hypothetical protein
MLQLDSMLKIIAAQAPLNKYKTYTNHSLTWFHVKENRGQQTANINTDKIGKTISYPSHVKPDTHPNASRQNLNKNKYKTFSNLTPC